MQEIFFLQTLRLQLYWKSIFYSYFSKILTRGSEELHFRIDFCSTPTFAEHHPTITSKAKYETAIHNCAKCLYSYEQRKKCFSFHEKVHFTCNLSTQTLFNKKIKLTSLSIRWTLFQFNTIVKLSKSFTLPFEKISSKKKQNRTSLYYFRYCGINLIKNERMRWFLSFCMRQYCFFY